MDMLLCEHDFVIISSHDSIYDTESNDIFISHTKTQFYFQIGQQILYRNAQSGTIVDVDADAYIIKKENQDA